MALSHIQGKFNALTLQKWNKKHNKIKLILLKHLLEAKFINAH